MLLRRSGSIRAEQFWYCHGQRSSKWGSALKNERKKKTNQYLGERKLRYFGHLDILMGLYNRALLEGCIDGKRGTGRPRISWYDNIMEWTEMQYECAARTAMDRGKITTVSSNVKWDGTLRQSLGARSFATVAFWNSLFYWSDLNLVRLTKLLQLLRSRNCSENDLSFKLYCLN